MKSHTRNTPANTRPHPLRVARIAKGLTLQKVAEILGTTKATVSGWELGRSYPRPATATRLVKLFPKLSMADIYGHALPRAA